jgi:hypothetical protein
MRKYLPLSSIFLVSFLSGFTQPLSQTRTATVLNNFGGAYVNSFPKATAQDVAANDGIYAYSNKLTAGKWYASLALQGFGFTIPDNATIENITVTVRRFKSGGASIKDYFVSVMQRYANSYGVEWTNLDTYPGNYYPNTEGEFVFSQIGNGNNGGYYHDQPYQWTPAMVNHPYFGLRVDVYPLSGAGYAVVYYDYVQITVDYSLPGPIAGRSGAATEASVLKPPIVYPNPFTTKTNIQFVAAESGKVVVELYNVNGSKVRTLFSSNVVQGQSYNVAAGDALLPKGIYVYNILIGKQKQTGRIMKLE